MMSNNLLDKADNQVGKQIKTLEGNCVKETEGKLEAELEQKNAAQSDIPRVSISMDTSSAHSVETCKEVSLEVVTPDSRANSTTRLLPQECEPLANCHATLNNCQRKKKQLLRSQTMGNQQRRISLTGNCFYVKPRDTIVVRLLRL